MANGTCTLASGCHGKDWWRWPRPIMRPMMSGTGQGHLQLTPGRSIDLDFVAYELYDLFRRYTIRGINYDRWNWDFFKPSLLRAGFTESMIAEPSAGL